MVAKTKYRCAGDTHPGMVRKNNEDGLHYDPDRGIFLVVDGIGGQAAGEKATEIALSRLRARLERQTGSPEDRIREAITMANNEIVRQAATNPEWKGMACVLTVALVDNGTATIGHVGDSRLYKILKGKIKKITHDHSPVGEREDRSELSESEAMRHPRRNEVYRDVGSEEHAPDDANFIELIRIPFEPEAAMLLCSDGLSDQVTSGEILRALSVNAGYPGQAVHDLIDAANRAGGKDNVTVLIVEGEQFAATRTVAVAPVQPASNPLGSKPALFAYGLIGALLLLGGLYLAGWVRPPEPPVRPPKTFHVQSGAAQFGHINDALAKAQAGDTIEVASGEYAEQLRLKDGVTIQGREPDVPILRAPPGGTGTVIAIVAENVKNARVSGFRILGDESSPISIGVAISGSDLQLQDSEISGAAIGVEIAGDSHAVLRANSIQDCRDAGIRITGEAAPRLLYNAVLHNGKRQKDPGPGIKIEDTARPVLQGNTFADNGSEPVHFAEGMDGAALMQFNFVLPSKPAPLQRTGETH